MQIFTRIEDFSPAAERALVLSLGNFDGVHLGHQSILKRTAAEARRLKGIPAVLTFEQHPQSILHPEAQPRILTSTAHKIFLFQQLGIEICFMLPFTETFSRMEAQDFINDILLGKLKVRKMILGYNARFGHGRKGDTRLMQNAAKEKGFEFEEVPPVHAAGDIVSSSRIRRLLADGRLDETSACLGRPFAVFAEVIKGDGRGKALGFPTANLKPDSELLPPAGVYPVRVRILKKAETGKFPVFSAEPEMKYGVLNHGMRPTFKQEKALSTEVHILDFEGDLYGKTLEVSFGSRIREEKAFDSPQELVRQIGQDIVSARDYFKNS